MAEVPGAAEAAAPASVPAPASASLLALEPRLQRQFQQKVQQTRKKRGAKVSGTLWRGGSGLSWPNAACPDVLLCAPQETLTPGVVYVGHLPRGLSEPQLREYFEQFGTVTRLRLSRSKKVKTLSRPGPAAGSVLLADRRGRFSAFRVSCCCRYSRRGCPCPCPSAQCSGVRALHVGKLGCSSTSGQKGACPKSGTSETSYWAGSF